MLKSFIATVAICASSLIWSQDSSTHLEGTIDMSVNNKSFTATYHLKNLPTTSNELSFMLNEAFKVEQIFLNNFPIASSKNGKICTGCTVHNILVNKTLTEDDILTIKVKGDISKPNKDINPIESFGSFNNSDNMVLASGEAKWYPTLIEGGVQSGLAKENAFTQHPLSYEIDLSCTDCAVTSIGNTIEHASQTTFKNNIPQANIALLAGDFIYKEIAGAIFINATQDVKYLEEEYKNILTYYTSQRLYLEDSVIVNLKDEDPTSAISYAVASKIMEKTHKASNAFHLFYQKSLTKYLSLKYLREYDFSAFINEARKLDGQDAFVRLDKIENSKDLNKINDYRVVPFQLLALENNIGEQKMASMITSLFDNLEQGEEGYNAFAKSLKDAGISQERIAYIETEIINDFTSDQLFPQNEVIVSW